MTDSAASYVVISRRYRPQNFDDLIGQEALGKTLKNAINQNRTAHAYLFTGPRGVGKTSAARILAKALRCESEDRSQLPCNKCPACIEVLDGNSIDVVEIDAASNTGVDNIRELRESVSYGASNGRYKVYIIDEVHMLSTAAFNALLKTLEEPPPHVVFIFATTEIHKVPATILSRCQRFDFKRIPKEKVLQSLETICEKEGVTAERDALILIADESEGCLRDAQSLLDQAIALSGKDLKRDALESALGFIPRKSFFQLTRALAEQKTAEALELVSQALDSGADPKVMLSRLTSFYRDLHFYKATQQTQSSDLEYKDLLNDISEKLKIEVISFALEQCLHLQSQLNATLDAQVALEALTVKLTLNSLPPAQTQTVAPAHRNPSTTGATMSSATTNAPSRAAPVAATQSSAPQQQVQSPAKPISPTLTQSVGQDPVQVFQDFLRRTRPAWLPVMKSLRSITPGEKTYNVVAEADFAGKRLASSDGHLVLKQCFGAEKSFDVQLVQSDKTAEKNLNPQDVAKQKLKEAKEDSAVQAALSAFKGSISETKILSED